MARVRQIKPTFFLDEDVGELTPFARLLFVALWQQADRDGRLEDRPGRIKAQSLPYDDVDIDALLTELASRGFIERYQVDGVKVVQVRTFTKHQHVHPREGSANLPSIQEARESPGITGLATDLQRTVPEKPVGLRLTAYDLRLTDPPLVDRAQSGEPTPEPETPEPPKLEPPPKRTKSAPRWRRVPPGEELTPERRQWATTHAAEREVTGIDWGDQWAQFLDYEFRDPRSDVSATWRTWCRNAVRFATERPANSVRSPPRGAIPALTVAVDAEPLRPQNTLREKLAKLKAEEADASSRH